MPVYNREKYVREALLSILQQTYPRLELLVVDDGSADGTPRILAEMEAACRARCERVSFLQQANQGTAATLNRLLKSVQGDFVYRLDSDDLAKPEAIEHLHEVLVKNPDCGLAVGDDELIDENGCRVYWDARRRFVRDPAQAAWLTFGAWLKALRPDIDFDSEAFGGYGSLLDGNYIPGGYLVRAHLVRAMEFTPRAPLEDHYMMLQLARLTRMKYLDRVLYSYRWHTANSILRRKRARSFSRRTLKYELENLLRSADPALRRLAEERLSRANKKTKLKVARFFEIYRLGFIDRVEYRLRLGPKTFILKTVY
jgi:alpha-1,3-rhamnosyltransferase